MKIIYTGLFVSKKDLEEAAGFVKPDAARLAKAIENPHVTVQFKPTRVDKSLFGELVQIMITGYGRDCNNEGFAVEIYSPNSKLQSLLQKIAVPHITISVGESGKPVDTGKLSFKRTEKDCLYGRYGAFMSDGTVCTQ